MTSHKSTWHTKWREWKLRSSLTVILSVSFWISFAMRADDSSTSKVANDLSCSVTRFYTDFVRPLETLLRLLFARNSGVVWAIKVIFPAWLAFVNVISKGYCSIKAFRSFVSFVFHFELLYSMNCMAEQYLMLSRSVKIVYKKFEKYVWWRL